MLVLVPLGAGAAPAMMQGRMTGFPPKNGGHRPPERQDTVGTICTVLDCGTPTMLRLYPFGAIHHSHVDDKWLDVIKVSNYPGSSS